MTGRVGGVRRVTGAGRTEWRRPGDSLGGEGAVGEWRAAWAAALDELEDDVRRAESLIPASGSPAEHSEAASAAVQPALPPRTSPVSGASAGTSDLGATGWALRRYGAAVVRGGTAGAVVPAPRPAVDMPMAALEAGRGGYEPPVEEILEAELIDMPADAPDVPAAADSSGPWQPPDIGPLPEELRERATALLNRQLAAAEALSKAMLAGRQHMGLLDRIDGGADEPRSAYVDRSC